MLVLAIEERFVNETATQPGIPKTYKVIVDGKVVAEFAYRGTAFFRLAEELDKKMFPIERREYPRGAQLRDLDPEG